MKSEDVALRRQGSEVPAAEILKLVCRELNMKDLGLQRRGKGDGQRPLTAYLLQKHGGLTQREIAAMLGVTTGAAVSVQLRQFKARQAREWRTRRVLARIERRLEASI